MKNQSEMERELKQLEKKKSNGTCASFTAKGEKRSNQWRAAIAQRYRSKPMNEYGIELSFAKEQSEDLIKLKKGNATILTIHIYNSGTVMIQGSELFVAEWIKGEFPVLAKLADGENYDDVVWNNTWLSATGEETNIEQAPEKSPTLSPEKRTEIR